MAGRIIGTIPRNFVIVLIENHIFYDVPRNNREHMSMYYRTAVTRQESVQLSDRDVKDVISDTYSPNGSIDSSEEPVFGSADKKNKGSKVSPLKEQSPDDSIQNPSKTSETDQRIPEDQAKNDLSDVLRYT